MNDWNEVSTCRLPGLLLALLLLLAPGFASADPLFFLRTIEEESVRATALENDTVRPGAVTLNENGDMVIRCRNFNVTLAYNPPDDTLKHPEQTWIALRQDYPAMSGISLKISFAF